MKFTVLSHAGLSVTSRQNATLIVDPWLLGSCYWRSWWNYPPVEDALVDSLRPDFIYLTHVHWDHFHGPSLRRFPKETPIYVPKGHHDRIRRDLVDMGFRDVRELRHGERAVLGDDFAITSYQFYPFLDSALAIECEGVTLLDANDAKLMGGPLEQVLARHPSIDFVFRSHSSANGRVCYDVVDAPGAPVDDEQQYIASFAAFVRRTGARFAVPFASNHCHLHDEVFEMNRLIKTPAMVVDYFRRHGIESPEVKLMLSGDSWSSRGGFAIDPARRRWFEDRDRLLADYREQNRARLDETAAREARAEVRLETVQRWCERFAGAVPWPLRLPFRKRPIKFVLRAGERRTAFAIDLWRKRVEPADPAPAPPERQPLELHTSALIFKQCMALDMFAHLSISKRVRYRVTTKTRFFVQLLNLLFLLFDYELVPLRKLLTARFLETWALRWRELLLYARIAFDLALGRGFSQERYIGPPRTPLPVEKRPAPRRRLATTA